MPTHEPQYYLRVFTKEHWYVLMALKYDKKIHRTVPTWRKELSIGDLQPYLYKTLVSARAGLDRYAVAWAQLAEVVIWKGNDANV